jgi:hypothetical protein
MRRYCRTAWLVDPAGRNTFAAVGGQVASLRESQGFRPLVVFRVPRRLASWAFVARLRGDLLSRLS